MEHLHPGCSDNSDAPGDALICALYGALFGALVDALVGVLDISSNSVLLSGLFDHSIHRFFGIWSFVAHGNLTYSGAYSPDFLNVAELHSPL